MDHIAIPSLGPFFFPHHPAPPSPAPAPYPDNSQRKGKKAALRTKDGCLTCRLRHKVCDKERADGACKTCSRFRIECLGFSPRRPDWMKEKEKVKICTDAIRNHLVAHGMTKGKPRLPANAPPPVHFLYFSHLVAPSQSQSQLQSQSQSRSHSHSPSPPLSHSYSPYSPYSPLSPHSYSPLHSYSSSESYTRSHSDTLSSPSSFTSATDTFDPAFDVFDRTFVSAFSSTGDSDLERSPSASSSASLLAGANASANGGADYNTGMSGTLAWSLEDMNMTIPDTLSNALGFRPSPDIFVPPPLPLMYQDPSLSSACIPTATHNHNHNHAFSYSFA